MNDRLSPGARTGEFQRAHQLVRAKRFDKALEIYACLQGPDARYAAAGCLHKLKRNHEARVMLDQCFALNAKHRKGRRLLRRVEKAMARETPQSAAKPASPLA